MLVHHFPIADPQRLHPQRHGAGRRRPAGRAGVAAHVMGARQWLATAGVRVFCFFFVFFAGVFFLDSAGTRFIFVFIYIQWEIPESLLIVGGGPPTLCRISGGADFLGQKFPTVLLGENFSTVPSLPKKKCCTVPWWVGWEPGPDGGGEVGPRPFHTAPGGGRRFFLPPTAGAWY